MQESEEHPDVVLIGSGVMSATLATLIHALEPDWSIHLYERLEGVAAESSDAWNNAGTGHSAFCELNYTPQNSDGSINIQKALKIAEQFEVSKEFWASLVDSQRLGQPNHFIRRIPHLSFVRGSSNVEYLQKRHRVLSSHHLFEGMQYSDSPEELQSWMPLMMDGRPQEEVAATRMDIGTDVNFGAVSRQMIEALKKHPGFRLFCGHEIRDIDPEPDGQWHIQVKDLKSGTRRWLLSPFVFIGAGGGTLRLLERSDIPEARHYGGFPVSGQFLVCQNAAIADRHFAKVYGKAAVGSPPMSVPHLDTRVIDGQKALLFGPYAGFSTRFLKEGSWLDLPASITLDNLTPMVSAGLHNLALTNYLLDQVTQSPQERLETLREFVPKAQLQDWRLENAGQRVQVIKKDKQLGGILEFGTEVVTNQAGTISGLLGASPGASTAVSIMLEILERCFAEKVASDRWQETLRSLIPSYGRSLERDPELASRIRQRSTKLLQLH